MAGGDDRSGNHGQSVAGVLRALVSGRVGGGTDEGLRERKKRAMRQHISDTATAMFLERGFDAVRVAEVAAACDVSEKTVYNYFPTKESLVFDRTDEHEARIREVLLGDRVRPVVEAAVELALHDVRTVTAWWSDAPDASVTSAMRRFGEMVDATPALRSAQREMTERFVAVAAAALADRAGVDAEDPEPQLAALAIVGIWQVAFRSMRRHADGVRSVAQLRERVESDVRRAARLAETGLSSFDAAVRRDGGRQGAQEAVEAVAEARRQVVAAVRQARTAWQKVRELHAEGHHDEAVRRAHETRAHTKQDVQRIKAQAKREAMQRAADEQRRRPPRPRDTGR